MTPDSESPWDVVVIGGGNAALVSALTAADAGARVLLLERAPVVMRGGNSRHTRNIRCVHRDADGYTTGGTRSGSCGATCAVSAADRATPR